MKYDPYIQKIKGKTQNVVGTIQSKGGQTVKGTINKIKGEVNEKVGNARINASKKADNTLDDWDDDTVL